MKKKRKHGAPKRRRNKARIGTPTRHLVKKLPSALDNATLDDLAWLVKEPPAEVENIAIHHHVPRPGDDPRYSYERLIEFDAATKAVRHYIRRKGEIAWSYEDNAARQQSKSAPTPSSTESPERFRWPRRSPLTD